MREEVVTINNLKINYKIAGNGPAVLLLHGWGGSSDSWLEVEEFLVKENYFVIAPDLPGFGKSAPPPEPWGIQDYSDFIFNFTEKLKLDSFFLLGHSFGGRIAIKFSGQHADKLKSLILCDAAGIRIEPNIKTKTIMAAAKVGNVLFSHRLFAVIKERLRNIFYFLLRNRDYVKADGVMRETIKKALGENLFSELPKIKVKTLIVWGEADQLVPVKCAHVFNKKIVGSQLNIMPKIGHSPHLEAPEKLSQIIIYFLKS
ncbi:MAG: alpha/beta hydrolase [Candidatus Nealsonbacteria bacterium]|nr:alpha/beta hydrolase [Candidatus Nealsonbacteria bacterium]